MTNAILDGEWIDLRAFHETSVGRPLVSFAVPAGIWLGALAVGLVTDQSITRMVMAIPLTLTAAQLFMLGHDAAHRSLSPSRRVNTWVARLAFVPSLHVAALWREQHDTHHHYTNLRGRDFVWTPLTVEEYRALTRQGRLLHRIERNRWGTGLGLHYAVRIWAPRMLWPRRRLPLGDRRGAAIDTAILHGVVAGLAVGAYALVRGTDPARAGAAGNWIEAVAWLVIVPLLATQWLIGFVIYLNHTHPDVVWYDDADEWARAPVQLEGSTGLRVPRRRDVLVPRRIMNHTAHHVDPGVPLRRLAAAQAQLRDAAGARVVAYDWSRSAFRHVLTRCKLYDYEARRWRTYAEAEADR